MPSYTNATSAAISVGSLRVEPGETKLTKEFVVGAVAAGLTLNANTPIYSPTLQSSKVTSTSTVTVPSTTTGNYQVVIYVPAGSNEVQIKLNDTSDVARYIGPGQTVVYSCLSRVIDNIIFTAVTGAAYVTIEAI